MRTTILQFTINILNMKKLLFALLAAVLTTSATDAQILWKISGNGAKNASYLLGTHHVAPLAMLDSIPGFPGALAAVDAVTGEIDMADMAAKAQSLMGYMLAPADSALTAVLTPAQADSLTTVLQRFMGPQVTAAQLAPMKPAAVTTQLAMLETMATMPEAAQQLAAGKQLDSEVQARALALGKEVIALETAEEQMALLMGAPITRQAAQLMEAVSQSLSGKSAEAAKKLADAYLTQNLDAIASMIFSEDEMALEDVEHLIFARNHNWVKALRTSLPQKSQLIAVGAGHLPGPEGLISLLQAEGYEVTPVK